MTFDDFWRVYPRRQAKLDAMKAWNQALKHGTAEAIIAGVERYKRSDTVQAGYICLPGTWLRQGRWMDEDAVAVPVASPKGILDECPHFPKCEKRWACGQKQLSERAG